MVNIFNILARVAFLPAQAIRLQTRQWSRRGSQLFLLFAVLLGVLAGSASAQTPREAWWNLVSVNHDSRTVTIVGKGHLCNYAGTWTLAWGDGSSENVSNQWYQNYSHTYANWGSYTIKLSYQCSGYDADMYSDSVTLVEPTATPTATATATNTLVPLEVSFKALRYVNERVFIMTETDPRASLICTFSGAITGDIRCPNRTLVHRSVGSSCGTVTVTARATLGGRTGSVSGNVEVPCTPTDTPTPLPARKASVAVSSQNDPNRSVTVEITTNECTGAGTWSIAWGDDQSTDIASPYPAQHSYVYSDWGVYTVSLTYTCDGGTESVATTDVLLTHPTPTPSHTPTATPTATATQPNRLRQRGRGDTSSEWRIGATAPAAKPDRNCLPAGAKVTSYSPQAHSCEVDAAGVGVQWIIDAGFISAIDVWSPLGVDAEVCFAGIGSLLLLDAAFAPRAVLSWPSYAWAGKTCARLDRAGTLVLMPGQPSIVLSPTPTATRAALPTATATLAWDPYMIADSLDLMVPLENCEVHSLYILNLRESPAGPIMRWFNGITEALARTPNWFQVVDKGELGWISAHYVNTSGDCG